MKPSLQSRLSNIPTILFAISLSHFSILCYHLQETIDLLPVTTEEFALSRLLYKWNQICTPFLSGFFHSE